MYNVQLYWLVLFTKHGLSAVEWSDGGFGLRRDHFRLGYLERRESALTMIRRTKCNKYGTLTAKLGRRRKWSYLECVKDLRKILSVILGVASEAYVLGRFHEFVRHFEA